MFDTIMQDQLLVITSMKGNCQEKAEAGILLLTRLGQPIETNLTFMAVKILIEPVSFSFI